MALNLTLSRVRGTIFGGALGDSIGLFTEFFSASECITHYGSSPRFSLIVPPPPGYAKCVVDRHRALFEPGAWTDDTDQSILILLSFLHGRGTIDSLDFAARMRDWISVGLRPLNRMPLGVGKTTGDVVRSGSYPSDPVGTAREVWERGERSMATNGAVMRTPVVGALTWKGDDALEKTFEVAAALSRTTHADPRCALSCVVIAGLVSSVW